jgi:hypothetical protein
MSLITITKTHYDEVVAAKDRFAAENLILKKEANGYINFMNKSLLL